MQHYLAFLYPALSSGGRAGYRPRDARALLENLDLRRFSSSPAARLGHLACRFSSTRLHTASRGPLAFTRRLLRDRTSLGWRARLCTTYNTPSLPLDGGRHHHCCFLCSYPLLPPRVGFIAHGKAPRRRRPCNGTAREIISAGSLSGRNHTVAEACVLAPCA